MQFLKSNWSPRGRSGHFQGGGVLEKKSDFKTIFLTEKSKDTEVWFKAKITKHGKKINDKEIIC